MDKDSLSNVFESVNKNISEIAFELSNTMNDRPDEFKISESGEIVHTSGVFYDHVNFVVGYVAKTSNGDEDRLLKLDSESLEHIHLAYIDWLEWNAKDTVKKFVGKLNSNK